MLLQIHSERVPIPLLTPEVLRQAQEKPHRLVVLVCRTTGGTQHQSFSPWSSGGPKNAIDVRALNHLKRTETEESQRSKQQCEVATLNVQTDAQSRASSKLFNSHIFLCFHQGRAACEKTAG